MTIDRYNVGWAASMKMRKEGVDQYLESHQKQAKPMVSVDALVFIGCLIAVVFVCAFLMGYNDGIEDAKTIKVEPSSRATKCTSYDIRDGQKYFLNWKRV
jgi:hypothetical protein